MMLFMLLWGRHGSCKALLVSYSGKRGRQESAVAASGQETSSPPLWHFDVPGPVGGQPSHRCPEEPHRNCHQEGHGPSCTALQCNSLFGAATLSVFTSLIRTPSSRLLTTSTRISPSSSTTRPGSVACVGVLLGILNHSEAVLKAKRSIFTNAHAKHSKSKSLRLQPGAGRS